MSLNIKSEEAHAMAKELAELTRQSITAAVTEAIRCRLEMVKAGSPEELTQRLLDIGADCARRLDESTRTLDHGELLYDERGLPA